ncbi:anti-sigma regulatory factor (Ser/Thr protein kinase) [Beggiatoa alba B18LD]|uniref:Anti-sigma regulatory factor (Ser/Thr protein kinase) n=1 Tax=Beggiatoa alba B18LD TaxID=395493 RepID=I3CCW8_9GAMM|nr:ATP-binding protein [Beggiatoa alba]EIJ41461.1 anti-sigma regulatory factor (Ser/Thr protein kinase) [Beggiatoa alba B18LD]
MPQLCLQIQSQLENVALIGTSVKGICSLTPLSTELTDALQIAIVEWLNNVIEHSYSYSTVQWITVEITLTRQSLLLSVTDNGLGLQSCLLNEATLPVIDPNDIENLPEGGFGLAIIKQIMDEVVYYSTGYKHTLWMKKHLQPDES